MIFDLVRKNLAGREAIVANTSLPSQAGRVEPKKHRGESWVPFTTSREIMGFLGLIATVMTPQATLRWEDPPAIRQGDGLKSKFRREIDL